MFHIKLPAVRDINATAFLQRLKTLDDTWGRFVMFAWKYARQAWLTTNAPVFLDFGYHDNIYWLWTRPQDIYPLKYLQVVKKDDFLKKYFQ